MTKDTTKEAATITEMGPHVDPSIIRRTYALMQPLQAPRTDLAGSQDVSYREDTLQSLFAAGSCWFSLFR